MNLVKSCVIVVLVGASIESSVAADESGPYVSASIGQANHAENVVLQLPGINRMSGRSEGEDTGWSLNAGYRFSRHFALELGYLDLGEVNAAVADASGASDARADTRFSVKGPTFSIVGSFPIGNWEPYLKAGLLFSETELEYAGTLSGSAFGATVEDDSRDEFFGGGVRYAFGEHWAAQLESIYVAEAGDRGSGESNFLTVFVGLERRF